MADKSLRTELKQPDEFVSFFRRIMIRLTGNTQNLLSSALGLVVLFSIAVGVFYYRASMNEKAANAFFPIEKMIDSQEESKDWKKIGEELDTFILRHGSSSMAPMAKLYRARTFLRIGEFEKAKELYQKVEKGLPKVYAYLAIEGQGYALMELKKPAEAETIFKKLSDQKENPFRDSHLWNLGLAQESAGKKDQALATFAAFETEFKSSPLLEKVQSRMAQLKKK